jgi:hypothetical protein
MNLDTFPAGWQQIGDKDEVIQTGDLLVVGHQPFIDMHPATCTVGMTVGEIRFCRVYRQIPVPKNIHETNLPQV